MIVWGKYNLFFTVTGAEAYRRDMPDAEVHLLDAGHFVLETHNSEAAEFIRSFLAGKIVPGKE